MATGLPAFNQMHGIANVPKQATVLTKTASTMIVFLLGCTGILVPAIFLYSSCPNLVCSCSGFARKSLPVLLYQDRLCTGKNSESSPADYNFPTCRGRKKKEKEEGAMHCIKSHYTLSSPRKNSALQTYIYVTVSYLFLEWLLVPETLSLQFSNLSGLWTLIHSLKMGEDPRKQSYVVVSIGIY
jgi:hypothetical protein